MAGIFERLLREHPEGGIEDVTATIAGSKGLSREEKLRLLRMGADHPRLDWREDALATLLQFDPPDAEERLVRELAHLPPVASVVRYGYPPEENIPWLVRKSDSPAVWSAFEQAARRVGPDLRANWIGQISNGWQPLSPPQREERIAFLRAFIDDKDIWHDKKDDSKDQQGETGKRQSDNPTHTVGNKAVEELGTFFPECDSRDFAYPDGLDAEGWARYRAAVRAALDKQK